MVSHFPFTISIANTLSEWTSQFFIFLVSLLFIIQPTPGAALLLIGTALYINSSSSSNTNPPCHFSLFLSKLIYLYFAGWTHKAIPLPSPSFLAHFKSPISILLSPFRHSPSPFFSVITSASVPTRRPLFAIFLAFFVLFPFVQMYCSWEDKFYKGNPNLRNDDNPSFQHFRCSLLHVRFSTNTRWIFSFIFLHYSLYFHYFRFMLALIQSKASKINVVVSFLSLFLVWCTAQCFWILAFPYNFP